MSLLIKIVIIELRDSYSFVLSLAFWSGVFSFRKLFDCSLKRLKAALHDLKVLLVEVSMVSR